MKNLMSNTNYGKRLETEFCLCNIDYKQYFILRNNYDNFLLQPLEIWMFVPCKLVDGVWVVLEEPKEEMAIYNTGHLETDCNNFANYFNEYQQAKSRCLFEGFESEKIQTFHDNYYIVKINGNNVWITWNESKTIEDLVKYKPLLTPTAQKQIGL